jgi:hypothetical protein
LAWYNAGSGTGSNQNFLDKAELLSAPPLADIEKGCVVIGGLGSPEATVCPTGQLGCNSYNSPSSWTQSLSYTDGAPSVRTWSGLNSCVNGNPTSDADNDTWKDMSIVDGDIATFSYPKTQITAWVCSSVEGTIEGEGGGTMNNSSPQAQLFLSTIHQLVADGGAAN